MAPITRAVDLSEQTALALILPSLNDIVIL